jgi:hypothetical protein
MGKLLDAIRKEEAQERRAANRTAVGETRPAGRGSNLNN